MSSGPPDGQPRPGSWPRNTDQVAGGAGEQLTKLWRAAGRLQRLGACVRAALPTALADRVQVTALQGGVLTLMVASAAWATRVRLATPELQRALEGLPEFTPLQKNRVKVAANPEGGRGGRDPAHGQDDQPRSDSAR